MKLRSLPARRRDVFRPSSLWMADDYLLSVQSHIVRESYRRFYFRDIQAIVVTHAPRYILSTRSAILGLMVAFGMLFPSVRLPAGGILLALVIAWLVISTTRSCSCRIYTAVSNEVLPAVHRLGSARRLLAELEPRIRAAQENLPHREPPAGFVYSPAPESGPAEISRQAMSKPRLRRVLVTYLMLAAVLADAAATSFTLMRPGIDLDWLMTLITVMEVGCAIWAIILHYRGILAHSVQRLAIVLLLFIGGSVYVQNVQSAIAATQRGRITRPVQPGVRFRQIYLGLCALFLGAGAWVILGEDGLHE